MNVVCVCVFCVFVKEGETERLGFPIDRARRAIKHVAQRKFVESPECNHAKPIRVKLEQNRLGLVEDEDCVFFEARRAR